MFEAIRNFFSRLFGWDDPEEAVISDTGTDSVSEEVSTGLDRVGFSESELENEDAASIPEGATYETVVPPEASSRSGTRGLDVGEVIEDEDMVEVPPIDQVSITTPKFLWCLDNGHGSLQAGKRSPVWTDGTQLLEWKFNREIVKRIMDKLEGTGVQLYNVVPEESVDHFLPERVARANNLTSDLGLPKIFVSIHGNAATASASGVECWYHVNSSAGVRLASVFQRHLITTLRKDSDTHIWKDRGIMAHSNPNRAFYVLRKTAMPAVLTENGFYTNEEECREMMSEAGLDKIALAHVNAILEIELNGYANTAIYSPNRKLSM